MQEKYKNQVFEGAPGLEQFFFTAYSHMLLKAMTCNFSVNSMIFGATLGNLEGKICLKIDSFSEIWPDITTRIRSENWWFSKKPTK